MKIAIISSLFLTGALASPVLGQSAPKLPPPDTSHAVTNYPVVTGWPDGVTPTAPNGYEVVEFARSLDYPRQMLVLSNGDVLVAEAKTIFKMDAEKAPDKIKGQAVSLAAGTSANRITLLRDTDGDGVADWRTILVDDLNQPFGMAAIDGKLYVANTDGLVHFPFTPGDTTIDAAPTKAMPLPAGGYNNHWTRNLLPSADRRALFISVGSASNAAERGMEEEKGRAAIHAYDIASGKSRLFASGLRNPVGMDWAPDGKTLWTAVNERDGLGDDLVPDYITSVKEGGFYGWPYSYFGQHVDPRRKGEAPALVARAIVPDQAVGSHVAALGLLFAPEGFAPGALVARHGSWNRSTLSGYDVVLVPFLGDKPAAPQPFLTGFLGDADAQIVYGRPVSLQKTAKSELLVADDAGGRIWLVRKQAQ
ncbi:MAG: L-sorbosone dehydrogenase [Sphingomonadales bacterium GWF1_63_6]|nr:MAG: L-sorbosone dehydrogenase [Sphingomonadales bacterium GWF1_63_6]